MSGRQLMRTEQACLFVPIDRQNRQSARRDDQRVDLSAVQTYLAPLRVVSMAMVIRCAGVELISIRNGPRR